MQRQAVTVNKQAWHKTLGQWVQIESTGHWPDTAIVVLESGKRTEVYLKDMEVETACKG